jgi:pimeloyl-ACP methyl ester carboxylesterase
VGDSGDGFRQPLVSDVPVLILAGDLDARTPLENGEELAATLSGARLVVVENAAHQFDVFGSAPIRAVLAAFLEGRPPTAARVSLPPIPFAP